VQVDNVTLELLKSLDPDSLIVLKEFDQEAVDDNDITVRTSGCVVSSPFLVEYIGDVAEEQVDGVHLFADGTYKLVFNGWVLVILAAHTVHNSIGG
jgi:hypothetical protein